MEDLYKEEEFYKDDGWYTESLRYCDYRFYNGHISEYGEDFDQFVLIDNALYPYIRLVKKKRELPVPLWRYDCCRKEWNLCEKDRRGTR